MRKDKKNQRTTVIGSAELDRFEGTVKNIKRAWDSMPDDADFSEREIFVEIASKVLFMQNRLREQDKDNRNIN